MDLNQEERKKYSLFLANVSGVGHAAIEKLQKEVGNAYDVYQLTSEEVNRLESLTLKQKEQLLLAKENWRVEEEYQKVIGRRIHIVSWEDCEYPQRLKHIENPPYLLYYYGNLPREELPTVAIIGSRMCSDYGRRSAEVFARGLANRGIQIISGMASGIDSIAQRAALDIGGKSYSILGSGVDICYPSSSVDIYDLMKKNGGLISEYAPGTKPEAYHFPMRNRIISGFADIILVIEAKERSGTTITVNTALEQGKDVYAVPGRIDDALSCGCNRFIRDGAGMACSVSDILTALGYEGNHEQIKKKENNPLDKEEQIILENLESQSMSAEELFQNKICKNCTIQELLSKLLMMQIKDYIDFQGGKYFVKK